MSTFLELVNDVARESGTMGGQSLVSVANATGRWAKLVAWTRQAWEMIQRERPDWTFLRAEFEAPLIPGTNRYTPANFSITDFGSWAREVDGFSPFSLYDPAKGRGDECRLLPIDYRTWSCAYDFGTAQSGRPTVVAVDYARKLCLGKTPDASYTLRGAYRRAVQSLANDGDTPIIDAEFHQAIVWRALILLGNDDESPFEATTSIAEYAMARRALVHAYTEAIEL